MGTTIDHHTKHRIVAIRLTEQPRAVIENVETGETDEVNIRVINHLHGYPRHWLRIT